MRAYPQPLPRGRGEAKGEEARRRLYLLLATLEKSYIILLVATLFMHSVINCHRSRWSLNLNSESKIPRVKIKRLSEAKVSGGNGLRSTKSECNEQEKIYKISAR